MPSLELLFSDFLKLRQNSHTLKFTLFKKYNSGHLGGSAGEVSHFSSGHDLVVHGFEPHVGLCADGSEPGAHFGLCVSLSPCPSPANALSLSQKISVKKNFFLQHNSMAFSILKELCNYHHLPSTEHFHHLKKETLCPLAIAAQFPVPSLWPGETVYFVSMDMPILDISYNEIL